MIPLGSPAHRLRADPVGFRSTSLHREKAAAIRKMEADLLYQEDKEKPGE
jgi:hypothetical protein